MHLATNIGPCCCCQLNYAPNYTAYHGHAAPPAPPSVASGGFDFNLKRLQLDLNHFDLK